MHTLRWWKASVIEHHSITLVAKPTEEDDGGAPAPRQQRLSFSSAKTISTSEIHKLVAGYVVEEMLPNTTVESPSFRKWISKIPTTRNTEGTVPDRKTFASYLDKSYLDMEKELKKNIWRSGICFYHGRLVDT